MSHNLFDKIISLDNLFKSWNEFRKGKENKIDIQLFAFNFEDNIFNLYKQLEDGTYQHSDYVSFCIQDPKLRHIHKAQVKDRVLHHAIMRIIEPLFEKNFIFDSYSSRKEKGTHKAVKRLKYFAWQLSQNNIKNVWVLKCDVSKFFASVNHKTLVRLIKKKIFDKRVVSLLKQIIHSFETSKNNGIPLVNLTSQLFSNIYLNELDQYVKRKLQVKCYIRYADDFVLLSRYKQYLEEMLFQVDIFLRETLSLDLHPNKIQIRKWHQGVDFLGYVSFPYYILLRTKTKNRMIKKISKNLVYLQEKTISVKKFNQSLQSYLGILKHCRGHGILEMIRKLLVKYRINI